MSYPSSDNRTPSILILTGILPVSEIERKKNENDILLVTEDNIKANHPDIRFHYIFTSPKTNRFLSLLSSKWASYYRVQQAKSFPLRGRTIHTLGIIMLPRKLFFRNMLYAVSFWLNRKIIEAIIQKTKPTIIHAQAVDGNAYFAKKISKKYQIPYIVTLRGLNFKADHLVAENLRDAKCLIAISTIQKSIAEKISSTPIKLISHGIPEQFFKTQSIETPLSPLKFIVVCRLLKLKNIDKVIKCLSAIKQDYLFHIYGEGAEKENLQFLINELDLQEKIRLKGSVRNSDLPDILQQYNVFIMPSYPETLGRVYFEAMACGLPVIASKNTGIDGIITEGAEGFLVDHNNTDSLNQILNCLFEERERIIKMRENAVELARKFRWENVAKQLYEIYIHAVYRGFKISN